MRIHALKVKITTPTFGHILKSCLCIFLIVVLNCEKNLTPVAQNVQTEKPVSVELEKRGSSLTEIWLGIYVENKQPEHEIVVWRDTTEIILQNNFVDSLLYDSALVAAKTYTYRAEIFNAEQIIAESLELQITTKDSTSHSFQWEIYDFPNLINNGTFNDVAIINENDIWCVGAVYADSANPSDPYNAAHWDGNHWELKKILYSGNQWPINSIYVTDTYEIWFDAYVKWDGSNFIEIQIPNVLMGYSINEVFGKSSDNFFVVGSDGLIVNYNSATWHKQESGTSLNITDIFATPSSDLYAVGLGTNTINAAVLRYKGGAWETIMKGYKNYMGFDPERLFIDQLYGTTKKMWIDENNTLYTVGNLMYQYENGEWDYMSSLSENSIYGNPGNYYRGYLQSICGSASNDIFIFGQSNTAIHFNGSTWRKIGPEYVPMSYKDWFGCDIKDDLIVAAGTGNSGPRIMMIRR